MPLACLVGSEGCGVLEGSVRHTPSLLGLGHAQMRRLGGLSASRSFSLLNFLTNTSLEILVSSGF